MTLISKSTAAAHKAGWDVFLKYYRGPYPSRRAGSVTAAIDAAIAAFLAEGVLGYVNVYKNEVGDLELGSADLDKNPNEPAWAAGFMEFVGKGSVFLTRDGIDAALSKAEGAQ